MNRPIELYVGFPDRSWTTDTVYVPASLPREGAVALAIQRLLRKMVELDYSVTFVGLYHYEEEPEGE